MSIFELFKLFREKESYQDDDSTPLEWRITGLVCIFATKLRDFFQRTFSRKKQKGS